MNEDEVQSTQVDIVADDDQLQLSELDAILSEATEVDGGEINAEGQVVEHVETEQIETAELLYPIISSGFDIFASKWKVPDKHKQALAKAYGDLLDKYFPDAGSMFGVELTALTVTGMVVAPHMLKSDEPPIEKPVKKPAKQQAQPIEAEFSYTPTKQETEGFKLD